MQVYKYGLLGIIMNWKHHAWIGAISAGLFTALMFLNFGWFDTSLITMIELGIVIFLSGLVPDLDHENGKLHQWMIGLGLLMALAGLGLDLPQIIDGRILAISGVILAATTFFSGEFARHRGFWHSIPACAIYGLVVSMITLDYQIGIVGFVGCYSHLVADSIPFKMK